MRSFKSKSEFSYPIFHDENDDGDEGNGDGEHGRQLNNEKPLEKKSKKRINSVVMTNLIPIPSF